VLGGRDFADPFVLSSGGTYYAFATGVEGSHVQTACSTDLRSWALRGDALPKLPSWASPAAGLTWAPAVLARGSSYVLYYVARDVASGFQCISRAVSASPDGPYTDESARPFVCQSSGMCGSIDPSPFVDVDGRAYLVWKSDENSTLCHAATRLWSQALSDDGLEVVGTPAVLVTADRPWEGKLIEGPSMWRHDGKYFLFYSANGYESARYAVGYATCAGATGPCEKRTTNAPLLGSERETLGPGGEELFADAAGRTWMAYHAWSAPDVTYASGGSRSLRVAPVDFGPDGPVVGSPL
jgi:beta-xylosidase